MAISTFRTFLMKEKDSESGTFEKLIDINGFPKLGGQPELIEITTLSDSMKKFIEGIQNSEALTFPANYDLAEFKKLKALERKEKTFAVWFGGTGEGESLTPTGTDGKYKFKGTLSVYVEGGDVNQAVKMQITVTPSTIITLAD